MHRAPSVDRLRASSDLTFDLFFRFSAPISSSIELNQILPLFCINV